MLYWRLVCMCVFVFTPATITQCDSFAFLWDCFSFAGAQMMYLPFSLPSFSFLFVFLQSHPCYWGLTQTFWHSPFHLLSFDHFHFSDRSTPHFLSSLPCLFLSAWHENTLLGPVLEIICMLMKHWHHTCGQTKNHPEAYFIVFSWAEGASWSVIWLLMSYSIWKLSLISLSSLSSISLQHPGASQLIILLQSQTRHFPSSRDQVLFLFWYLSLLPSPIFHLAFWDFSFPLLCLAVWHLFAPHLPSDATSHSSTLISLPLSSVQIYFSFHNFPCSPYLSPCSSLPT